MTNSPSAVVLIRGSLVDAARSSSLDRAATALIRSAPLGPRSGTRPSRVRTVCRSVEAVEMCPGRRRESRRTAASTVAERRRSPSRPPISARTGRWSEPECGKTTPDDGPQAAPRTKMWSIWLCGRHVGHVGPTTARCQPRHEPLHQRPPGVHVAGQHRVRPGRGAQPPPQLGPVAVRAHVQVRHVGARHRNRPAPTVTSTTSAARVTRSARNVRIGTTRRRLNRQLGPHQDRDAPCRRARPPASAPRPAPAAHGAARRPCRAPCSGPAMLGGPASCGRRPAAVGCAAPTPSVCATTW